MQRALLPMQRCRKSAPPSAIARACDTAGRGRRSPWPTHCPAYRQPGSQPACPPTPPARDSSVCPQLEAEASQRTLRPGADALLSCRVSVGPVLSPATRAGALAEQRLCAQGPARFSDRAAAAPHAAPCALQGKGRQRGLSHTARATGGHPHAPAALPLPRGWPLLRLQRLGLQKQPVTPRIWAPDVHRR